jgi:hypothetical protein
MDLCDEVDAQSEDACGTSGGAWTLNEDVSNKTCSQLQSEMHATMIRFAAFSSMGEDGQPLDPAPDMSSMFIMFTGMYRAEVGEVCCDGYAAANLTCVAEDLPIIVSAPPGGAVALP